MFSHLCRPGLSHLQIRTFPFDPATRLVVFAIGVVVAMHVASHLVTNSIHLLAGMVIRREIAHWAEKIPIFLKPYLGEVLSLLYALKEKYMYLYNHVSVDLSIQG